MKRTTLIPLATLAGVAMALTTRAADPLPSWNDGAARKSILQFVERTTRAGSPDFVPPAERIAVFDNDGTLWPEQPIYTQVLFGMDRAKALAPAHPDWKDREPFRSALAGDLKGLEATGVRGLVDLTAGTAEGLTPEEFDRVVTGWLAATPHPRFHRPYTQCVYQPMLEVLAWLRANGFKTYVVTGGSLDFVRPWTESVYGVPPEQVIGSTVPLKFGLEGGKAVLRRLGQTDFIDDREGKAISIQRVIGRRPIAAFGNSDGDLPMLQWTDAGTRRHFCLFVRHTDARREWAYDRDSGVGRLNKGLDEARTHGWTVVDMAKDWKRVFPFDKD